MTINLVRNNCCTETVSDDTLRLYNCRYLHYTAAHGEILHYSFFAMLLLVGYAVYPQKEMEEVELEGEF